MYSYAFNETIIMEEFNDHLPSHQLNLKLVAMVIERVKGYLTSTFVCYMF